VGGGDSSSTVSYASQIAPLLKANCQSCHSGANATSGIDLSTYSSVKSNANVANSAIQEGLMPPTGPLSAANKQLFQSWVTAGAPNN
jgi:cytochrome c peroxidase